MKKVIAGLVVATTLLAGGCDKKKEGVVQVGQLASEQSGSETFESPRQGIAAGVEYYEIVTGGAADDARLPLVVGLHGFGSTPKDFLDIFKGLEAPARVVTLRALNPQGKGFSWWPMTGSNLDTEETAKGIAAAEDKVATAIAAIAKERPTVGKPIVTGFSQGGALSFAVAARHPDAILAAYPLSGWLPPTLRAPAASTGARPPIHAFHGTLDDRVSIDEDKATVAALVAAGYPAELEEVAEAHHQVTQDERQQLYKRVAANIASLR
jgi:phospholipase/carboxylesterase